MKKMDKSYFKSIAILLGVQAFMYYFIKLFASNYNLVAISLDKKIPFIPEFILIYDLWYPFLLITLYFLYKQDKDKYILFFLATALGVVIGDIIFIAYPSEVIRPEITGSGFFNWAVGVTYKGDSPAINCLPSMHCYFCFCYMTAVILSKKVNKWYRLAVIIASILIISSTLFVKQHVIMDVITALALTFITYLIFCNKSIFEKTKKKLNKLF